MSINALGIGGGYLAHRRRYMKVNSKPYDSRIEYLEVNAASGGQPYINTNHKTSFIEDEMYFRFMAIEYKSSGNNLAWFGENISYNTGLTANRMYWIYSEKKLLLDWNNNGSGVTAAGTVLLSHNLGEINTLEIKDREYTFNGIKGNLKTVNTAEGRGTLRIFNALNQGTGDNIYGRVYAFRITMAGAPVLDLIPVRKDGVGYMYDNVSGELFGNAGSGKFLLGPDV